MIGPAARLALVVGVAGLATLLAACHAHPATRADPRAEVGRLADDEMAAWSHGDTPRARRAFVPDALVFTPEGVAQGRGMNVHSALPETGPATEPMTRPTSAATVDVGLAPDQRAAWIFAAFDLNDLGGVRHLRMTALAAVVGEGWQILAASVSEGVAAEDALLATAPLEPLPDGIDASQTPLGAKFVSDLGDLHALATSLAERDDAIIVGSIPGEVARGTVAIRAALVAQADEAHAAMNVVGGVRARLVPGGEGGWVAANVDLVSHADPAAPFTVRLRVLAFYLRDGDAWQLVSAQFSSPAVFPGLATTPTSGTASTPTTTPTSAPATNPPPTPTSAPAANPMPASGIQPAGPP